MIKVLLQSKIKTSLLINKFLFNISVYEGISPALLATMSLSQGIKGTTNSQLISSLTKSNIIKSQALQKALALHDRRYYIPKHLNPNSSPYENRPYKIHGGQNMTDIFTQAIILEELCFRIQGMVLELRDKAKDKRTRVNLRILDVGTGHGFIAGVLDTLIGEMIEGAGKQLGYQILGIDSNSKAIQYAKLLQNKLKQQKNKQSNNLIFSQQSLQDLLFSSQHFHIIIGGFYMPPTFHQSLLKILQKTSEQTQLQTFGIWATDSSSGQSLYSFTCQKYKQQAKINKNQILSTIFSMPTVKTSVSRYFLNEDDSHQNDNNSESQQQINLSQKTNQQVISEQQTQKRLIQIKRTRVKQEKQRLKQQLKQTIQKYTRQLNKKLSLQQMRSIQQINTLLQKLNKTK